MVAAEPCAGDSADWARYFVPETFTPLFFSPFYRELTPEQRRRYNQLHGCYCNEQIMFFERFVAENVLSSLLRRKELEPLQAHLRDFVEEERRHTKMFYDLNRLCLPRVYARRRSHFVVTPPGLKALLAWATRQPWLFPLFVWLMLLQEERAVFLGREALRCRKVLEPHFVAVQRAHLADEIGHVEWDQEILSLIWATMTPALRKLNAVLFCRTLREFMITPKLSNLRVLQELAREFPELAPRLPEMRRALLALESSHAWNLSLYARAIVPKTFAQFDRWKEFSRLSRVLCGYQPEAELHG